MIDNYFDVCDNVVLSNIYLDVMSIFSFYIILLSVYNV